MTKVLFEVMDRSGDAKTEFNVAEPAGVKAAMDRFHELTGGGQHIAYAVEDGQGTLIREFDPAHHKNVVFHPRRIGG